jgi:hypothetical protein
MTVKESGHPKSIVTKFDLLGTDEEALLLHRRDVLRQPANFNFCLVCLLIIATLNMRLRNVIQVSVDKSW